jgi:hypothetical protein
MENGKMVVRLEKYPFVSKGNNYFEFIMVSKEYVC